MRLLLVFLSLLITRVSHAQFLMDMLDTTTEVGKGMLSIYRKYDNLKFSGYIQPQFQISESRGARSFNGGDFAPNVNNRFMLRRGRLRVDYIHFSEGKGPSLQFVFQFDGTERGVFARDFWGRVMENRFNAFSLTMGLFARPFSYELNLSSNDRETPERGRMSQLLTRTERDIGVMGSFDLRKPGHFLRYLKIDAGIFNGQGLTAAGDYDSHKDFIARVGLKPYPVARNLFISVAGSYLNGGIRQNTRYVYRMRSEGDDKSFAVDSSFSNEGKIAPRKYYGADAQLRIKHKYGNTEFRAEVVVGRQTATQNSSETPAAVLMQNEGYFIRRFNGAYFYFLQHLFHPRHQLAIKYDWYDPNTSVSGRNIGKDGNNVTEANIKYRTLGFGYIFYAAENLRVLLWYDKVNNEYTSLPGFEADAKDDVFTCRLHFRF